MGQPCDESEESGMKSEDEIAVQQSKALRFTLDKNETSLWHRDDMRGWRDAMIGVLGLDYKKLGYGKYIIYDLNADVLKRGEFT